MAHITGTHAIRQALQGAVSGTLFIVSDHPHQKEFLALAKRCAGLRVEHTTRRALAARGIMQNALLVLSEGGRAPHARGFASVADFLQAHEKDEYFFALVLDHLQDAQNLGAVFRSAAVFGADGIIRSARRSAPENEYAAKASSGAMSVVPSCAVSNIRDAVERLKEAQVWTYALDMDGRDISAFDIPKRCAFVLGNEHEGIAPLVKKSCDEVLAIPMARALPKVTGGGKAGANLASNRAAHNTQNTIDSLNVSVSAGIACYEYYRAHSARFSSR